MDDDDDNDEEDDDDDDDDDDVEDADEDDDKETEIMTAMFRRAQDHRAGSSVRWRGRKSTRRGGWTGGPIKRLSFFPWHGFQGLPLSFIRWELLHSGLRACWTPILP